MDLRRLIEAYPLEAYPGHTPHGTFRVLKTQAVGDHNVIVFENGTQQHTALILLGKAYRIPDRFPSITIEMTGDGNIVRPIIDPKTGTHLFFENASLPVYQVVRNDPGWYIALPTGCPYQVIAAFTKNGDRFMILETNNGHYLLKQFHSICGNLLMWNLSALNAAWDCVMNNPGDYLFSIERAGRSFNEFISPKPTD
jgi:hypothetical protein